MFENPSIESLSERQDFDYLVKYVKRPGCTKAQGMWQQDIEDTTIHKYVKAAKALKLPESPFILDLGAGCGNHLAALMEAVNARVVAQDLLQSNLEWLRGLSRSNLVGVCAGDAYQFLETTPPNMYDAVMSNAVVGIVDGDARCHFVKLILRVVKPLGKVWVGWNTFNMSWWRLWT